MPKLSPELKELVLATKSASLPTAADSARILEGLRIHLGETAVAGIKSATGVARGSSPAFPYSKVVGLGVAGLSVLGGLWLLATRHHEEPLKVTGLASSVVAASSESIDLGDSRAAQPSREASAPVANDIAVEVNLTPESAEIVPNCFLEQKLPYTTASRVLRFRCSTSTRVSSAMAFSRRSELQLGFGHSAPLVSDRKQRHKWPCSHQNHSMETH